jgi:hypothetical protein
LATINHTRLDWVPIKKETPLDGSTVVAFTPTWGALRFRVVHEEELSKLSDATHWAYLTGPIGDPSN